MAYHDVRADDLSLHLDLPRQDALLVSRVDGHGWNVELRILGASHQVLVSRDGPPVWSEVVTCRPAGSGLPAADERRTEDARYAFRSHVSRLSAAGFERVVTGIRRELADDPAAVCAAFPGDPLALTALRACIEDDAGVAWQTWHTYPQTLQVVHTASRMAQT